jgi:hypothetical protein
MGALSMTVESWSNVAANAAQVAAIVIGGWWAYDRFIRQREKWPRASLEQRMSHRALDDDRNFVRLDLRVQNTGEVVLQLTKVRAELYRVLPLTQATSELVQQGKLIRDDDHEADWPCLTDYEQAWEENQVEIEPGESDEFGFDFVIPAEVTTILLYAYIWNASKSDREIGWPSTSLYDLNQPAGEKVVERHDMTSRG